MEVTRDGCVASERVGSLWLAATGGRRIEDDAWREYLGHATASVTRDGPFHGVLFWAPKHGPSTGQRKMLTHEFAKGVRLDAQRRVALVSDSALVRGTMTAIQWFTRSNVSPFAPREAERALAWLSADIAFDRAQATRALEELIDAVHPALRRVGTS
jgi:hypothetical protein